jgi:hypothetical protein
VRKIGPNAHRAKPQVMTAITSVCIVKAWAGSLLAVASKEIREAHPAESQDKGKPTATIPRTARITKIKPIATTGPLRRKIFMGIRPPDSLTLHLVWNCDGGGSGVRVAIK